MGFDLCVFWQAVSLINLKMKRMVTFEKPVQFHVGHLYMPWFALFLRFFPPFLCLPEWTNAMSAAILFPAND